MFAKGINSRVPSDATIYNIFAALLIACCGASLFLTNPAPLLIPFGILFVLYAFAAPKKIYYLFFLLLPFSIEQELPGGFGTDIPSEPIMIFIMVIVLLYIIKNYTRASFKFLRHPVSIILIIHLSFLT